MGLQFGWVLALSLLGTSSGEDIEVSAGDEISPEPQDPPSSLLRLLAEFRSLKL